MLRELEKLKDCMTSEKNGEFLGDVHREPGGTKKESKREDPMMRH